MGILELILGNNTVTIKEGEKTEEFTVHNGTVLYMKTREREEEEEEGEEEDEEERGLLQLKVYEVRGPGTTEEIATTNEVSLKFCAGFLWFVGTEWLRIDTVFGARIETKASGTVVKMKDEAAGEGHVTIYPF